MVNTGIQNYISFREDRQGVIVLQFYTFYDFVHPFDIRYFSCKWGLGACMRWLWVTYMNKCSYYWDIYVIKVKTASRGWI